MSFLLATSAPPWTAAGRMFVASNVKDASRYLRQITPGQESEPEASATVDSGRSRTASSSESPSEAACDCALFGDHARVDRTRHSPSTHIGARMVQARLACSCATAPMSLAASEIWSERPPIASLMVAISFSRRAKALSLPCLAPRCFVQRRMESQMSSVPPRHHADVNAGSRGRFRTPEPFSGPRPRTAVASGSAPPSESATKGTLPSAPKARSRTRATAGPRAR